MSEEREGRLSRLAVAAFVLGLVSPLLSIAAAVPALYLGVRAVWGINSSEGQLRGRRLAIAGLILGGVTLLATVLGSVALLLLLAQDKGHLAGCTNNLRLIGLAVNRYSDHHEGHFPPATVPNLSLTPDQRLSWEAAILSYLAEGTPAGKKWQELAGTMALEAAWDASANAGPRQSNVPPYLCPAFIRESPPGTKGLTAYVGVAGVGRDAASLSLSNPHAGFFGYERRPTREEITAGISNTMMAVETTRDNGPWLAGGTPTVRGLDPDEESYIGRRRPFGGLHREGLNVLWADGSARRVREDVSPDALRASACIVREDGE